MLSQAVDFRDESRALHALLSPLSDAELAEASLFKGWTPDDIVAHLDQFNRLADESLVDPDRFEAGMKEIMARMADGTDMRTTTERMYAGLRGQPLLERWREGFEGMAERWVNADPKQRLPWFGPSMSVRSSITARLMETWAHGQAAYDLRGMERVDGDRIRNIVVLGVNTFGWTFANRGLPVPAPAPHLVLTAPSGEIWRYNDPRDDERIEGLARDFCQVVTQVRNVADTGLHVTGAVANRWMSIAQCFAGQPENPPAPGARHRRVRA
ncbi:MAG: TIGR03084 family metal-binding protein [Burkholderiaceae bacterium]